MSWGDGLSTGVDSRASLTLNRGQRLGVPSVNVAEGSAFAAQGVPAAGCTPVRRLGETQVSALSASASNAARSAAGTVALSALSWGFPSGFLV